MPHHRLHAYNNIAVNHVHQKLHEILHQPPQFYVLFDSPRGDAILWHQPFRKNPQQVFKGHRNHWWNASTVHARVNPGKVSAYVLRHKGKRVSSIGIGARLWVGVREMVVWFPAEAKLPYMLWGPANPIFSWYTEPFPPLLKRPSPEAYEFLHLTPRLRVSGAIR